MSLPHFEPSSLFHVPSSVQKNDVLGAAFRRIVLKTQDVSRWVKWAFPMRAFLLALRMGYQRVAYGSSRKRVHAVLPRSGQF